ncbi:DNA-binding response regulator [Desulfuromonas versatilis]|uniref:DNA-binding response regulator n=1 Tax=Desulfuromonas versatilis TaxID=2802975 RepID=A0ABN6E1U1_9BACT|nr:response regulator [Desulfuromonas versatilis]BCR06316.1 DNA-binding response regulator [Desulfuromonas versatilis]
MKERILIVEDEERLADLHRDYLRQAGYETDWLASGETAVEWVKENRPNLVLLDLMLPGKDGLEICKEVRRFSDVPIIMVTARVEEIDRLIGLELGADDYICKPFSPREVVARVKTVLRRSSQPSREDTQTLLSLDEESYQATLVGEKLDLTALEFKLLSILANKPGRIYSRDQLMDLLYSDQRIVCDRTIDSHIKKLRKKISAAAKGVELIHSIYGVGYKYEPI